MTDAVDHALAMVRAMCSVRVTTDDIRELAVRTCACERNTVRAAVKIKNALEERADYYEARVRRTQEMTMSERLYERSGRMEREGGGERGGRREDAARLRRLAEGLPVTVEDSSGATTKIYYRPGRAWGEGRASAKREREAESLKKRHTEIMKKIERVRTEPTQRVPTMPDPRTLGDKDYEIYLRAFQKYRDTVRGNERQREEMRKMQEEREGIEKRLREIRGAESAGDRWEREKRRRGEERYTEMGKERRAKHARRMCE